MKTVVVPWTDIVRLQHVGFTDDVPVAYGLGNGSMFVLVNKEPDSLGLFLPDGTFKEIEPPDRPRMGF